MDRVLGEPSGVVRPHPLVTGGDRTQEQDQERVERPVIMRVDQVLGHARPRGDRHDRSHAADVGRDRQHAQTDDHQEADPLQAVIVGDDGGCVEAQHKQQPHQWKQADEDVQMRPGFWDYMHEYPPPRSPSAPARCG